MWWNTIWELLGFTSRAPVLCSFTLFCKNSIFHSLIVSLWAVMYSVRSNRIKKIRLFSLNAVDTWRCTGFLIYASNVVVHQSTVSALYTALGRALSSAKALGRFAHKVKWQENIRNCETNVASLFIIDRNCPAVLRSLQGQSPIHSSHKPLPPAPIFLISPFFSFP